MIKLGIIWEYSRVLFFTFWGTGTKNAERVIAVVTHERLNEAACLRQCLVYRHVPKLGSQKKGD